MDAVDAENHLEVEGKTQLINQVLEPQHTLQDLPVRGDAVMEENLKLKSENQVLRQYTENFMSASSVFQTTDTKSKRKYRIEALLFYGIAADLSLYVGQISKVIVPLFVVSLNIYEANVRCRQHS
ncbi:short coiled-coil protein B-like [Pan paniscus]|nr:short coiled-coil protein B-like [Pan paniscus]